MDNETQTEETQENGIKSVMQTTTVRLTPHQDLRVKNVMADASIIFAEALRLVVDLGLDTYEKNGNSQSQELPTAPTPPQQNTPFSFQSGIGGLGGLPVNVDTNVALQIQALTFEKQLSERELSETRSKLMELQGEVATLKAENKSMALELAEEKREERKHKTYQGYLEKITPDTVAGIQGVMSGLGFVNQNSGVGSLPEKDSYNLRLGEQIRGDFGDKLPTFLDIAKAASESPKVFGIYAKVAKQHLQNT